MPSILFVCRANRIRSPLAAALWVRRASAAPDPPWHVASAGVWAKANLPALAEAVAAGAALGVDLTDHRSQSVDAVDLADFDLILTMERGQRDALRAELPAEASRIVTLAEFATGYAYDVVDPVGRPPEFFLAIGRELDGLVARALARFEQ